MYDGTGYIDMEKHQEQYSLVSLLKATDNVRYRLHCPDLAMRDLNMGSIVADFFTLWDQSHPRQLFILASDTKKAQRICNSLRANTKSDKIFCFEEMALWGSNRYLNYAETKTERIRVLYELATRNAPIVVCSTMQALLQHTQSLSHFKTQILKLSVSSDCDLDEFVQSLENSGYHETDSVSEPGYYAVRGGIIDVFPSQQFFPIRIEFIGDLISSIRLFDHHTQKSHKELQSCSIAPALEFVIDETKRKETTQVLYEALLEKNIAQSEREAIAEAFSQGFSFQAQPLFVKTILGKDTNSAIDFLSVQDIVILDESYQQIESSYEKFISLQRDRFISDVEACKATVSPDDFFSPIEVLTRFLKSNTHVIGFGDFSGFGEVTSLAINGRSAFSERSRLISAETAADWFGLLKSFHLSRSFALVVICQSLSHSDHLKSLFDYNQIGFDESKEPFIGSLKKGFDFSKVHLYEGDLNEWAWVDSLQVLLLPDFYFSGQKHAKPLPKPSVGKLKAILSSFQELKTGAFVVHSDHGIGIYSGIKSLDISGFRSDFLVITYADQDKVYVPVEKLHLVQKYSDAESQSAPTVDRLRTQAWNKRKSRVQKAIKDIAEKLLQIQAKRKMATRVLYSPPSDIYFEFESDFPFDETDDQLRAIDDVNADLSAEYPMDRLICGDVGFGKTEIALRAAMRVVQDGWQVLLLAPTTVLSFQHFRTFSQRFEKFGVEVRVLNRFVKTRQVNESIDEFKNGKVDILIGTHRLLSKDIRARKLGLVIIDEEQRFGVSHKEIIKDMRSGVDMLTLTATPIPRSLHMSLLGLRDISVITTPPKLRLPIKTFVSEFEDDLISKAILQEIKRGGQVFFVHNRVATISKIAERLEELVPGINVRFAHGQMRENHLESIMIDFIEQKFPVLVCTTIIESGLDIPNANTIIVNEAQNFGLAALYQLRGRVGRSSRQSYAYFLTKSLKSLSKEGERRLEILATHQDLGSGFQIANYDLEMRGAGNLLGGEQSGHIAEVGAELYTSMVQNEIARLKGETPLSYEQAVEMKLHVPVQISHSYISSESERLRIYKRLFSALTVQEVHDEQDLVRDRFGKIPRESEIIFLIAQLKVLLGECKITRFWQRNASVFECVFQSLSEKEIKKIMQANPKTILQVELLPDFSLRLQASTADKLQAINQGALVDESVDIFARVVEFLKVLSITMRS